MAEIVCDVEMRDCSHDDLTEQPTEQEFPTAEDSPHNILNALNDFCLQMILERIDYACDFLSAAEVCKRFQANAKACFSKKFSHITIVDVDERNYCYLEEEVTQRFVSLFGHNLQSIAWHTKNYGAKDMELFDTITEFCGKTLKGLKLYYKNLDFNTRSRFEALETLELDDSRCKTSNYIRL